VERDLSLYRPNVGVVLFNADGRVWLGHRINTPGPWRWQFPQGGVDEGEDLETAARRELFEETGVRSVEYLDRTPGWIAYDFPPAEIDLEAHGEPEFDAWRWAGLDETPSLIVPFKRAVYEQVLTAFARFAG